MRQALTGQVGPHQRFLLAQQLVQIDALDRGTTKVSAKIARRLRAGLASPDGPTPSSPTLRSLDDINLVQRLSTIPGICPRAAEILLAEIGPDVRRFPTPAHLASWAGMCPSNHESAGKRTRGKSRRAAILISALS